MHQCADDRIQDAGNGQHDCHKVQGHGKGQVQLDGSHHPAGERHQVGQFLHLIVHQGDIGRIHSDITAGAAHGDAHIGLFQGRGIIHPITDHADGPSLILHLADMGQFILGQTARIHLGDAQFFRNAVGGTGVVAGQQGGIHAQRIQPLNGGGALLPQGIGQR